MVKRTLFAALLASGLGWAEPTGPTVIHGGVQIQTQGATTQIQQTTDRAIINWNGFNIDVHELVRFIQPNQLSVILNRVVGGDPSNILGQLQANGRVFLVNPNGIVFGPSARVDVGGLMATTLSLSDQDFLRGNYHLVQDPSFDLAAVINQGELKVADGGFLLLVAPMVNNEGVIVARAGQVGLVGSTQTTINFDGQGLIEVSVPAGRVPEPGTVVIPSHAVTGLLRDIVAEPGITEATRLPGTEGLVLNSGRIDADGPQQGGRVLLDSTQASVVTSSASIHANGGEHGGDIRVLSEGTSVLDGRLEATGAHGGQVELSGRDFALRGVVDVRGATQEAAGRFLLDPPTVTIVDGSPYPLDPYLPNILLGDNVGLNQLSRSALEAQPMGSNITIEADHLITVEDMALDQIALARDVYLNLYVANGDLVFQDIHDTISTLEGGGIFVNLPHGGSTSLGSLVAPGGRIQIHAATDLVLQAVDTFSESTTAGTVEIQTQGNLSLSSITATTTCLQAGQAILNPNGHAVNVEGQAASFVAGTTVGTASQPIGTHIQQISGLAEEFHFQHATPPEPALVCGIDGLHLRGASVPPPDLALIRDAVDRVPIFQVNEVTTSPLAPVPQPESIDETALLAGEEFRFASVDLLSMLEQLSRLGWKVGATEDRLFARKGDVHLVGVIGPESTLLKLAPQASYDADQPLREALAFVRELPGYQITSEKRTADVYQLQFASGDIMPLFDGLWQRGWVVQMTADGISAHKEDLVLHGKRSDLGASLQVRRQSRPDPVNQDLDRVLAQLMQTQQPQQIEANPYSLVALLETLSRQGWVVRLTSDRLVATKEGQTLLASLQGPTATLKLLPRAALPSKLDELDFLATLPGLRQREYLSDYQRFTYQLGGAGLMPWIDAFRQHGFRLQATTERFQARRGKVLARGAVNGSTFTLKVGSPEVFQAQNVDQDLRQAMAWLRSSFRVQSEQRLVDQTRLQLASSALPSLRQQLRAHGWVFNADGSRATYQRLKLKMLTHGHSVTLIVERK